MNFDNFKKDNMSLICIDLAAIYRMWGNKSKGADDEVSFKKSATTNLQGVMLSSSGLHTSSGPIIKERKIASFIKE